MMGSTNSTAVMSPIPLSTQKPVVITNSTIAQQQQRQQQSVLDEVLHDSISQFAMILSLVCWMFFIVVVSITALLVLYCKRRQRRKRATEAINNTLAPLIKPEAGSTSPTTATTTPTTSVASSRTAVSSRPASVHQLPPRAVSSVRRPSRPSRVTTASLATRPSIISLHHPYTSPPTAAPASSGRIVARPGDRETVMRVVERASKERISNVPSTSGLLRSARSLQPSAIADPPQPKADSASRLTSSISAQMARIARLPPEQREAGQMRLSRDLSAEILKQRQSQVVLERQVVALEQSLSQLQQPGNYVVGVGDDFPVNSQQQQQQQQQKKKRNR